MAMDQIEGNLAECSDGVKRNIEEKRTVRAAIYDFLGGSCFLKITQFLVAAFRIHRNRFILYARISEERRLCLVIVISFQICYIDHFEM